MATEKNEQQETLAEKLFEKRIILIDKEITEENCGEWIGKIILLDLVKTKKPIILLINSYGGDMHCGFGLSNVIEKTNNEIITACIGIAQSAAAGILASGNKRFSVPDAQIMIHQQWCIYDESLKHDELLNEAKASLKSFKQLTEFYLNKTKMTKSQIENFLKKDTYMTSEEALKYGIIDSVGWDINNWLK